jgi:mono/diheme cytochrome c family protein
LIEADWLRQALALEERTVGPVSTSTDARGACDGVKNGKYGFHTGLEANPWWQVDLGETKPVSRVRIFNRLDYAPGLHNADHLRILTSEDGQTWVLRHEHNRHFGGIAGAKPLDAVFPSAVPARFVRLQVPSDKPIFFHLDEVEVFGPADPAKNLALHRPANQSSLSPWSTAKRLGGALAARIYPTREWLERGRRLAADLQNLGRDTQPGLSELDALAQRLASLPKDAPDQERRDLYVQARWAVRRLALANPLLNFDRLLFVKKFTQETYPDVCLNHMPWVSRPGGDLCILSAAATEPRPSGSVFTALAAPAPAGGQSSPLRLRALLNRALGPGHVHGLDLWYGADRIVFGFARAQSDQPPQGWLDRARSYALRRSVEPIHLFEVGVEGQNLRQLTTGEWSDLDPTYAPNGDVVFVSERCGTSLQCNEFDKDETSCNLYVIKPDGSGLRRLSANKDGDYLPHTLDDGNIAYTRWEYHERSWAYIQSIWILRPDGTAADAIFKQHFVNPWAIEETRSIPGSKKLVAIAAGHHTLPIGPLLVVDPAAGINNPAGIRRVTPDVMPPEGGMDGLPVPEGGVQDGSGFYATPWALSEKYFLVSYSYGTQQTDATGFALYLVDVFGNKELLYRDPAISCFSPIPLRPRPRPPVYPDTLDESQPDAICLVNDASFGCDGIAPEQVRFIRISEPIGWPYDNQRGGQRYGEDHGYGGPGAERKNLLNWTPVRILGDVPVESDGSAHFKVPPDTAVYFQLLDAQRMELRRMRSFLSFQPGEIRACVGCHESRAAAPIARKTGLAARRAPSVLLPAPWGDQPVSFLRDIQPVLDDHCASCHTGLKPAGGLDFSGGLITFDPAIPGYGHYRAYETIMAQGLVSVSQVRAQDASITPPLAYGARKSKLIQALGDGAHTNRVRLGETERLRLVMWIDANAPYHDRFVNKRAPAPAYDVAADQDLLKTLAAVHERRCAPCHQPGDVTRLDWLDLRRPKSSLFLSAPLRKEAGGSARCPGAVYPAASDPDYQAVFQRVTAAAARAQENPRRDLQSLYAAAPRPERPPAPRPAVPAGKVIRGH